MIFGGCFLSEKNRFIEAGKAAVTASLFDPKAAEFRNITVSEVDSKVLCGEVNGKNRFGAYTGFTYFVALHFTKDIWYISIDSSIKEDHETYVRLSKQCRMDFLGRKVE